MHVRDPLVTQGVNSVESGLGIYEARMQINDRDFYHIRFDEILDSERQRWASFFHTEFNVLDGGTESRYGNNDYLEMRRIGNNDRLCYPHKLVDGHVGNGVWVTRQHYLTEEISETTPIHKADLPNTSRYKDGVNKLNFTVSDAANNANSAEVEVILDNFKPYLKTVEVDVNNDPTYLGTWREIDYPNVNDDGRIFYERVIDAQEGVSGTFNIYMFMHLNQLTAHWYCNLLPQHLPRQ
ncbi:MAG: hypothetical protein KA974_09350 [Saprospiraceae bacterium]|nr:hypothetical protein [Saprospiraceae bacterium]